MVIHDDMNNYVNYSDSSGNQQQQNAAERTCSSSSCTAACTDCCSDDRLPSAACTDCCSDDGLPSKKMKRNTKVRIAVAGCSHGEMEKMYATITELERRQGFKFDLLICCGDYQAVRNMGDLSHMHVPERYRHLQEFYRYYSGELKVPVLTLFVGGNHEASGFLQELPNGGWVAPKIYYMGHASVVRFGGLRIAGLSGIYNKNHYDIGHWERPPFAVHGAITSIYHVRSVDVFRLRQLKAIKRSSDNCIDVFISHDWPAGITDFGDVQQLLKKKPYFEEDIKNGVIGNPATMALINDLKPRYWFAAHMHCSFPALVPHSNKNESQCSVESTRFLSLDKPIPGRHFIQVLEIDGSSDGPMCLSYDPVWLAILRATDDLTVAGRSRTYMPSRHSCENERWDFRPNECEVNQVHKIFGSNFTIPFNFRMTAPPHGPETSDRVNEFYYRNPQTSEFCFTLGINDLNEMLCNLSPLGIGVPYHSTQDLRSSLAKGTEEIALIDASYVIDKNPSEKPFCLSDFATPILRELEEK